MSDARSSGRHATPAANNEEVARLRAELSRVSAERDALEALAGDTVEEMRGLLARQSDVLRDTIEAQTALARIRGGMGWRLIEALRRIRLRARRLVMAARGWRRPRLRRGLPSFVREAPLGVNVAGYLNTESGMGEAARLSIRSLAAAGVPCALTNVPSRLRMGDQSYSQFTEANPHPFNLVHLNADNMESFARARGRDYFRDRYTIGYWFWELAEFRADWMGAFQLVDEVWAASEFGRAALSFQAPVPVLCMPLPIVAPAPSPYGREHFGLHDDQFVFLFTFDVSSQMERKNPFGLIQAFRRAFGGRRDVVLALKFTNAEYDQQAASRLYRSVDDLSVLLLEGYLSRDELAGLMQAADCYVSLHRSEGFGLTIAEAMALGKPVIATRYSGNVDFMTPANSYAVEYRLVRIERDYGPYLQGVSWADPDLEHAATLMRRVVEDRGEAAQRGRQAAADIAAWRSPERTGAQARARLEAIRAGRVEP
jgi:glycosyltransferase involved in cell wall biosynthesis